VIKSWSPSRLEKYGACPSRAKYEFVDKLCPLCFNGKLTGWDPQTCDHCARSPEIPEPIARGNRMHEDLEMYVTGRRGQLPKDLQGAKPLANALRSAYKDTKVKVEMDFVLGSNWEVISKFSKDAWIRAKIDILHLVSPTEVVVIDWKSGGVDRDSGAPKNPGKYADQLSVYSTVVLSALPAIEKVTTKLLFLDATVDQEIPGEPLLRKNLKKSQDAWTKRVKAMLTDKVFAPRPGYACRYCPFTKNVGGPCRF
jgi:hypothetical protein